MTSAYVVEYRIEKGNEEVGHFRKHMMCKLPDYADLLVYQPLNEHTITPFGYDEEEEYWENDTVNLEVYLRKMTDNKIIKEYFNNNK